MSGTGQMGKDGKADFLGWRETRSEPLTARLVAEFRATLAGRLAPGLAVPPGVHWGLVPDIAEPALLGRDGHPRPGIFIPSTGLPRRMWAGGELTPVSDFHLGETVTRETEIAALTHKQGSTGPLAFLSLTHRWSADGVLRLVERQDLVYRPDPTPGERPPTPAPAEDWPKALRRPVETTPTLLFRFSALTFNGHRIHYDHPYATAVEGYAGLVVHGPMQAVWMLNLACELMGGLPGVFRYRGLAPLICGEPAAIEAQRTDRGLALRVRRADGVATMQAEAQSQAPTPV